MGEVAPPMALPVKPKRRRVDAVRTFPRGCGPNAVRVSLKPPEETISLKDSGESEPVKASTAAAAPLPPPEVEEGKGSGEAMVKVETSPELLLSKGSSEIGEGFDQAIVESLSTESSEIGEGFDKDNYSKMYGPAKRRKIAVLRSFPRGCGRNAPRISREKGAEVEVVAPIEKKGLEEEKKVEVNEKPMLEDAVTVVPDSGSVNSSDGEKATVMKQKPTLSQSGSLKSSDGEKVTVAKKEPVLEGPATVIPDSISLKRADGENVTMVKQKPAVSTSGSLKSLGGEKATVAKKKPVSEGSVKAGFDSCRIKSLDGVKMTMAKPKPVVVDAFKVASAGRGEDKEKRDDGKQKKDQEISGEAPSRSALRNGLNESSAEERREMKVFVRSTSHKLVSRDARQVGNNMLKDKERLLDATPPSESRLVDEERRRLMPRPGGQGLGKHQKDPQIVKRKLSGEIEDEGRSVGSQGNESLEAYGDRLIVQALMSAENCPWRKGKKSGGMNLNSATPKNKAKRNEKSLINKSALKRPSASRHANKVDEAGEEDSLHESDRNEKALVIYEGSQSPDEENQKALAIYKRSRELSVTVTPSAPLRMRCMGAGTEEVVTRSKVKKVLRLFQVIFRKLLQGEEDKSKESGKIRRIDLQAASILKDNNEWVNSGKNAIIGNVPGVEVGDEFHYRVELAIVGLHRPFQGGIDFTKINGTVFATSIVASGGYPDDMDSSDALIYSGSGGNPAGADKQPGDQKLERGNLALKNSIGAKTPVRVIHGFKELKPGDSHDARAKTVSTFTYDGLYLVERCWTEKGPHGNNVFKFLLRRIPGQPELALQEAKKSKKSKVREGLCSKDISQGKEIMPICAVNTVDNDQPMPFNYVTKTLYPSWYVLKPPKGCDCTDGCSDSEKCACAVKNGGEIPFNYNGSIVQAKPLVYECGPSCKCPPSCHNRVSQHGMKILLEIFKTKSRGWGVRSLYSIPSGSFICEYVGEMLQDTEAEQRNNDEYLFDIGHNYDDHSLWEGLPSLIPGLQSSSACETVEDVGFTIDAAEYGNVGRFINHSCSPNLYAQNVLYDHDDKRMPHIMFFAADNIPPLQELTYHYNYMIDHVRDSDGNIKRKDCFCGSPECTGRLY